MGAVPQTSLPLSRKRETLGCAMPPPSRRSHFPQSAHVSRCHMDLRPHKWSGTLFVWASLASMFNVCDHLHVGCSSSKLLVFLIHCKNPTRDLLFIFRSLFLDVIVRKQQDLWNETPIFFRPQCCYCNPRVPVSAFFPSHWSAAFYSVDLVI